MMSALHTADTAFRPWADKPFSKRSKIIAPAAQLTLERKEDLARLAPVEMGKRIAESRIRGGTQGFNHGRTESCGAQQSRIWPSILAAIIARGLIN